MLPRVAAIHDISCFGKCSLTVALPIISAAAVECSVIPTAVLSTHTGGFTNFTFRDLTEDITPIAKHWQSLGLHFDAVYTGYLGSEEQVDKIIDTFERVRSEGTRLIVDPVMADNGQLYGLFAKSFPQSMKRLCEKAGLIVPNVTEAVLMLGEAYVEPPYTREYIDGLLERLAGINHADVVLTGVCFEGDENHLGAACRDSSGKVSVCMSDRVDGYYHGTGDVFASAMTAALVKGTSLPAATRIAVDFTVAAIKRTARDKTDVRFGVDFESGLSELSGMIEAAK